MSNLDHMKSFAGIQLTPLKSRKESAPVESIPVAVQPDNTESIDMINNANFTATEEVPLTTRLLGTPSDALLNRQEETWRAFNVLRANTNSGVSKSQEVSDAVLRKEAELIAARKEEERLRNERELARVANFDENNPVTSWLTHYFRESELGLDTLDLFKRAANSIETVGDKAMNNYAGMGRRLETIYSSLPAGNREDVNKLLSGEINIHDTPDKYTALREQVIPGTDINVVDFASHLYDAALYNIELGDQATGMPVLNQEAFNDATKEVNIASQSIVDNYNQGNIAGTINALASGLGTLGRNIDQAPTLIADSAGYMAQAAIGASGVGLAAALDSAVRQATLDTLSEKVLNGEILSKEEMAKSQEFDTVGAMLGVAGQRFLIGSLAKWGKPSSATRNSIFGLEGDRAISKALNAATNVGVGVSKSAAGEGFIEGLQNVFEQAADKGSLDQVGMAEVLTNVGLGAIAGAPFGLGSEKTKLVNANKPTPEPSTSNTKELSDTEELSVLTKDIDTKKSEAVDHVVKNYGMSPELASRYIELLNNAESEHSSGEDVQNLFEFSDSNNLAAPEDLLRDNKLNEVRYAINAVQDKANVIQNRLDQANQSTDIDLPTIVTKLENGEYSKDDADTFISLTMANPSLATQSTIDKILESNKDVLTAEQIDYLKNFTPVPYDPNANQTTEGAHSDVMVGRGDSSRYGGVREYLTNLQTNLISKNQPNAMDSLTKLSNLAENRYNKATVVNSVMEQLEKSKSNEPVYIQRGSKNRWEIAPAPFASEEDRRLVGGFKIQRIESKKVVAAINKEAEIAIGGFNRGRRAFASAFGNQSLTEVKGGSLDIKPELVKPQASKPARTINMPMYYRDGQDSEHKMVPKFKGKSTFELIQSGDRTATTGSKNRFNGITKGTQFNVVGKNGETQLVEATTNPYLVRDVDAATWSKLEGWDESLYKKHADKGSYQIQYKLVGEPVVSKPTAKGLSVNESTSSNYKDRTKLNVESSDVTIGLAADYTTLGEKLTQREAGSKYVKHEGSDASFVDNIVAKLEESKGSTINVTGNGIYTWKDHGKDQDALNKQMFDVLSQVKEKYPDFTGIVTGGQTGSDIAGAVAAKALGLDVTVNMPKGFKQRDIDGVDFTQTKEDVNTYIESAASKVLKPEVNQEAKDSTSPASNLSVEKLDFVSRKHIKANPDTLFLFGDNDAREGFGGQAKEMRGEPNSIGIRTKSLPSMGTDAFWTDATLDENIKKIDEDFARVEAHKGKVVIPSKGLGTGLSELAKKAPETFAYLQERLDSLGNDVKPNPVDTKESIKATLDSSPQLEDNNASKALSNQTTESKANVQGELLPTEPIKKITPEISKGTTSQNGSVGSLLEEKNVLKVKPSKSVDLKAISKAKLATKYIGFGEEGSSTALYAKQVGDKANTGSYTPDDVVFVSINGGSDSAIRNELRSKTIEEALVAGKTGATLITDNASYIASKEYNKSGEGRLAKALEDNGFEYGEQVVGKHTVGVWRLPKLESKPTQATKSVTPKAQLEEAISNEMDTPSELNISNPVEEEPTATDILANSRYEKYLGNEPTVHDSSEDVLVGKDGKPSISAQMNEWRQSSNPKDVAKFVERISPYEDSKYRNSEESVDLFEGGKTYNKIKDAMTASTSVDGYFKGSFSKEGNEVQHSLYAKLEALKVSDPAMYTALTGKQTSNKYLADHDNETKFGTEIFTTRESKTDIQSHPKKELTTDELKSANLVGNFFGQRETAITRYPDILEEFPSKTAEDLSRLLKMDISEEKFVGMKHFIAIAKYIGGQLSNQISSTNHPTLGIKTRMITAFTTIKDLPENTKFFGLDRKHAFTYKNNKYESIQDAIESLPDEELSDVMIAFYGADKEAQYYLVMTGSASFESNNEAYTKARKHFADSGDVVKLAEITKERHQLTFTPSKELATAIGVAAVSVFTESGQKFFNTKDSIKRMLGLDKHSVIDMTTEETLRSGNFRSMVISKAGNTAYNLLGLYPTGNYPVNLESSLKELLGSYVVNALINIKALQPRPIRSVNVHRYTQYPSNETFNVEAVDTNELFNLNSDGSIDYSSPNIDDGLIVLTGFVEDASYFAKNDSVLFIPTEARLDKNQGMFTDMNQYDNFAKTINSIIRAKLDKFSESDARLYVPFNFTKTLTNAVSGNSLAYNYMKQLSMALGNGIRFKNLNSTEVLLELANTTNNLDNDLSIRALNNLEILKPSATPMRKLFNLNIRNTEPTDIPSFVDYYDAPATTNAILKKENRKPSVVNKHVMVAVGALGDYIHDILGYDLTPEYLIPVDKRLSIKSKNENIVRIVKNNMDFLVDRLANDKLDKPLFFERDFWVGNFRAGQSQNVLNAQTDKLSRSLLSMDGWKTVIDTTKPSNYLSNFKSRIAEAFGKKVENFTDAEIEQAFDGYISNMDEKLLEALNIINDAGDNLNKNTDMSKLLTEEQKYLILDFVLAADEKAVSLHALLELARFIRASNSESNTEFTTYFYKETDAKTSGPALTAQNLATPMQITEDVMQDMIESGESAGFYTDPNDTFTTFHKRGGKDMYQKAFIKIEEDLSDATFTDFSEEEKRIYEDSNRTLFDEIPKERGSVIQLNMKETGDLAKLVHIPLSVSNAIQFFTGKFFDEKSGLTSAARNLTKVPVTSTSFGSSIGNVTKLMSDEFREKILDKLHALAKYTEHLDHDNNGLPIITSDNEHLIKQQNSDLADIIFNINKLANVAENNEVFIVPAFRKSDGVLYKLSVEKMRESTEPYYYAMAEIPTNSKEQIEYVKGGAVIISGVRTFDAIEKRFLMTIGEATKTVFTKMLDNFYEVKKDVNTTVHTAAAMYISAFETIFESLTEKLIKENSILTYTSKTKNGDVVKQLMDLSKEYTDSIRDAMSDSYLDLDTAQSSTAQPSNNKKTLLKKEKVTHDINTNPSYHVVSKFKKLENDIKSIPQLVSEWETYGESLRMINNGVATIVNAIHAMDSSMAMNTYSQFNALNVHDAIVSSMADSNQVAITYNREAYRQLRDYSVLDEVKKSVIKTLSSISDKIDTNTHLQNNKSLLLKKIITQFIENTYANRMVNRALFEVPGKTKDDTKLYRLVKVLNKDDIPVYIERAALHSVYARIKSFEFARLNANRTKLDWLSRVKSVDHLTHSKGNYVVTDDELGLTNEALDKAYKEDMSYHEMLDPLINSVSNLDINKVRPFIYVLNPLKKGTLLYLEEYQVDSEVGHTVSTDDNHLIRLFNEGEFAVGIQRLANIYPEWNSTYKGKNIREVYESLHGKDALESLLFSDFIAFNNQVGLTITTDKGKPVKVGTLLKWMDAEFSKPVPKAPTQPKANPMNITLPQQSNMSSRTLIDNEVSSGAIGVISDPKLAKVVEAIKNNSSVSELIKVMKGKVSGLDGELLNLLEKSLEGSDVKVKILTKDSKLTDVYNSKFIEERPGVVNGFVKSRGAYVNHDKNSTIFIKSSDLSTSGITAEFILHELFHAATANVLRNKNIKDLNVKKAIENLKELHQQARQFVRKNKLENFEEMVSNLDEFISYSMTDRDFRSQVIDRLAVLPSMGDSRLVKLSNGMRAILSAALNILGLGNRFNAPMARIMADVAVIMEANKSIKADYSATLTMSNAMNTLVEMEPSKVLQELQSSSNISQGHFNHLSKVLDSISTNLDGVNGSYRLMYNRTQSIEPEDMFVQDILQGRLPFVTQSNSIGFGLSNAEAYVAEQVKAVMQHHIDNNLGDSHYYLQELKKAYKDSLDRLSPESFYDGDWDTAQYKYDFLFNGEKNPDYLSNFAALVIASEEVRNLTAFKTTDKREGNSGSKILDLMNKLFSLALRILSSSIYSTYRGQNVDEKVSNLMRKLSFIDAKHKRRLFSRIDSTKLSIDLIGSKLQSSVKGTIDKAIKSHLMGRITDIGSKSTYTGKLVAKGAKIGTLLAKSYVENTFDSQLETLTKLRHKVYKSEMGFVSSLLNDMRGITDSNAWVYAGLQQSKALQNHREDVFKIHKTMISDMFANTKNIKNGNGKYLTDKHKKAITNVVLRTNSSSLLDTYTLDDIEMMLTDDMFLSTAIKEAIDSIPTGSEYHRNFFVNQSKLTGIRMATGRIGYDGNVFNNTYHIARMTGSSLEGRLDESYVDEIHPFVDRLSTLYAIKHSSKADKKAIKEVFDVENAREDEIHGLFGTMYFHLRMQKDLLDNVLAGDRSKVISGYVPDITNPTTVATLANEADGKRLLASGYEKVPTVFKKNSAVPGDSDKNLYVAKGGGLNKFVSGAFSTTEIIKYDSPTEFNVSGSRYRVSQDHMNMLSIKRNNTDKLFKIDHKTNSLFQDGVSFTAPVLNVANNISEYRNVMDNYHKDTVMERDHNFIELMARFAASTLDKANTPSINAKMVQEAKNYFNANYKNNPNEFVLVGAQAKSPEMISKWRLLPESTRKEIQRVWGSDNMYISVEHMNALLGFRMPSFMEMIGDREVNPSAISKIILNIGLALVKRKGGNADMVRLKIARGENMWETIVQETKDMFVVRNIMSLLNNFMSNATILTVVSKNPVQVIKLLNTGFIAALNYQEDSDRLNDLEYSIKYGIIPHDDIAPIQQEIKLLKASLEKNPVNRLVKAGLKSTIVEDVNSTLDDHTYKSLLATKLDPYTSRIPTVVKDIFRHATFGKGTPVYSFLNRFLQLSDFVARYALYEIYTTRKVNPLPEAEAMKKITESFVMYDMPSHKNLEKLNALGIVPFSKYYIRIPKVIMTLFKDHPLQMLGLELFGDGFSDVVDSAPWNFRNPFGMGALEYPNALMTTPLLRMM
ncbi:MAG: hypothetical protein ACMV1B_01305 [Prevotella sp.]